MSDRFVEVAISKDGGRNWTNWRRMSLGLVGEYWVRQVMRRLGVGRDWRLHIRVSSPIKRDLLGAVGDLRQLNS